MDDEDPNTVEEIFADYGGRRRGLLRALTRDVDRFYDSCDPELENLCLYAYSNGRWEVKPPGLDMPTKLPEPTIGINFARDGMRRKDWIRVIAAHSDGWLLAVSFHLAAGLNRNERNRLFNLINNLPTLSELVRQNRQR